MFKIGDLVYSVYPKIHGEGCGIVLEYNPTTVNKQKQVFLATAKVYWSGTGKSEWIRADVLTVGIEE